MQPLRLKIKLCNTDFIKYQKYFKIFLYLDVTIKYYIYEQNLNEIITNE